MLYRVSVFALLLIAISSPAHAQWPALYFRADPFLRMNLARPDGGSGMAMSVYSYSAESYFDGLDQTPHTSKADAPNVRFQREEYIFTGVIGLSRNTAAIAAVPVSYVKQRLFESGAWGVEKAWVGVTHALDRAHHYSVLAAAAIPIDGQVGNLHFPVAARDESGFITVQFIGSRAHRGYAPSIYLRAGVGMYTSKEEYYGRRLYEFPGELRLMYPLNSSVRLGLGSEGRFVVGAPDNRLFDNTLSSHDAFAFGPDIAIRLTPDAHLHATYRQDVFGFYATAGSYWGAALVIAPSVH